MARSASVRPLFQDCKLTGADLAEARTLGLILARYQLINAQLPKISFRHMELDCIDLQCADFREDVLTSCSLREANVINACFEAADLRGADLGALKLPDASRFKGDIISKQQTGARLNGLGLKVV